MEELLGMLDQVQFCGFFDGPTEQEYDDVVYKGKSDEKPKKADERKDDIIAKIRVWVLMILTKLQSGVAGCVKDVVTCFLEVPLACLGSMAAVELSENMLQNLFLNLLPQTVESIEFTKLLPIRSGNVKVSSGAVRKPP